jgi:hypothetical protein
MTSLMKPEARLQQQLKSHQQTDLLRLEMTLDRVWIFNNRGESHIVAHILDSTRCGGHQQVDETWKVD